jgi:hypothetical protein
MDIAAGVVEIKATNIVLMFMLRHSQIIFAITRSPFSRYLSWAYLYLAIVKGYAYDTVILACPLFRGFRIPNASSPGSTTAGPLGLLGLARGYPLTNIRPSPRSGLTSILEPSQSISFTSFLVKLPSEDCHRFAFR